MKVEKGGRTKTENLGADLKRIGAGEKENRNTQLFWEHCEAMDR